MNFSYVPTLSSQSEHNRSPTTVNSALEMYPGLQGLGSRVPLSLRVWAVQQAVYHAFSLIFQFCDETGAMRCFKARNADRKSYAGLLLRVLFNQCFVLLPSMILVEYWGLCFTGQSSQVFWKQYLMAPLIMTVGHDVVQYFTHRHLLHQPNGKLTRALGHSVHHTTGATKAISACYMSAPDFFLEIVLPYLVPLAIVGGGGRNTLFHSLVAGLGAIGGLYEHSGYDFSGIFRKKISDSTAVSLLTNFLSSFLDNRSHTEHHVRGTVSFSDGFGSPGICDTIFGTRWDLVAIRRGNTVKKE
ncbi:LAME_0A08086g1_1 [Lachancea meyersii CBS 8951]|uniref:LAME_0A08086g1_1 n=1 Tax=Lachancea meyersii CBS 8951 TaxID=1266667 RepID=A0A1G4IR52_9SACH|nr:LAME_0A08086g1_1 [Lachancea meyersii CBS 8951]